MLLTLFNTQHFPILSVSGTLNFSFLILIAYLAAECLANPIIFLFGQLFLLRYQTVNSSRGYVAVCMIHTVYQNFGILVIVQPAHRNIGGGIYTFGITGELALFGALGGYGLTFKKFFFPFLELFEGVRL